MPDIVVITGVGGMGSVCARRLAQGRTLALIDCDAVKLDRVAAELADAGYDLFTEVVDVADGAAVEDFARKAGERGEIRALMHTAGISGSMGTSERVFAVNLVGTAHVIDAFEPLMSPGSAAVMIASMGSISIPVEPELAQQLAHAPTDALLDIALGIRRFAPVEAYCLSKRGNQLRVNAAALRWGKRGARINSVSPGIISTPMGHLEAQHVPAMAAMRRISPIQRIGQPEDIASAAEFLLGPNASFITGIDLPVDGGVIAAQLFGSERAF